jgi:hypothetical protein
MPAEAGIHLIESTMDFRPRREACPEIHSIGPAAIGTLNAAANVTPPSPAARDQARASS